MPSNDIIDSRDQKLADHINCILGSTEAAKFAVGYFFLSGLEAVAGKLAGVSNLRILIGNTTNRETIEQIAEGYQRLELAAVDEERERYLKRSEQRQRAEETADNLRRTAERMDQTDDAQALVKSLVQMIMDKRLRVRVYTKGRMHAKAYIFDYRDDGRYEKGIGIVGSSNLTLSGLTHNTELNVVVHGNDNHAKLTEWFEGLWEEAQEFDELLMQELRQSWAEASATPYDIYMKTLYALVADRLDEGERGELLWDDELTRSLADFQKTAVRQAIQIIKDQGGAFVSDVVGLGKSYVGAAVLKHFVRTQGAKPLIICPKTLEEMWQGYDDEFALDAKILPMSMLKLPDEGSAKSILDERTYKDRDFVLIDESHNFRHHSSQRYEVMADFLSRGLKKVCLVTATPRNRGAGDVYNQIKLFHQDDITQLPIDPPNLKEYFKMIERGQKRLQDLLPAGHNALVMKILKAFENEVKHRQAQLKHGLSLTTSQVYVLRELRAIFSRLADEETDLKAQVVKLEEAFKKRVTAAIRRQLNTLRRNGVTGSPLVRSLADIYHDHGLHEQVYEDRRLHEQEAEGLPRIICSEAFV
jgi:hypothetical protein